MIKVQDLIPVGEHEISSQVIDDLTTWLCNNRDTVLSDTRVIFVAIRIVGALAKLEKEGYESFKRYLDEHR